MAPKRAVEVLDKALREASAQMVEIQDRLLDIDRQRLVDAYIKLRERLERFERESDVLLQGLQNDLTELRLAVE